MCGISGVINQGRKVKHPLSILLMRDSLVHRGPDAKSTYISPDGSVVFGHRRLSLVGLDNKATIMSIPQKDRATYEVALVFNGEIYNYKKLKQYFVDKGYSSVSPSDFEVIIFAWQEWGKECVDHLIGEFAFLLYDEYTKEIFMARDRTGVKPLFYSFTEAGEFIFASEPKAILAYPDVPSKVNTEAIAEFLLMGHSFAAGVLHNHGTFYEGIYQLPAGYYATLKEDHLEEVQYYDLPFSSEQEHDQQKNIAAVRKALLASVDDRIPEEVEVSVGLSGGLDSSIIAALVHQSKKSKNLLTSCVSYTADENEDLRHATILAKKKQIRLTSPTLSPENLINLIDSCITASDGPIDSIRRMGMMANYKHIHEQGYKVALIGEGADEMHLGYYHTFPGLKLDRDICQSAETLRSAFKKRAKYVEQFFSDTIRKQFSFDMIIDRIVEEGYENAPSNLPLQRMQYFYAKKFLQYLEDANDRAAMAYSIEARLPFLDPTVIKVSLNVPTEQNVTDDSEKEILRAAFKKDLPTEIQRRNKAPFPANSDLTLHKAIVTLLKLEVHKAPSEVWTLLNREAVLNLVDSFNTLISKLEVKYGDNKGGQELVAWLPLSSPMSLRINQAFSILTLLRWLQRVV